MPTPLSLTHHRRLDTQSIDASGWLSLLNAMAKARFYHHPDWYLAIDEFLLERGLEFCSAHNEQGTMAIVPGVFAVQRHRFRAPAHDHLSLGDVLLHPTQADDALDQLIDSLLVETSPSLWDLQVGNVPAHSRLALACADKPPASTLMRKTRESAWFDLSGTLPPGGKLRRNLNRLRSKLSNDGQIRLQWVDEESELDDAFNQFLILEASGWKGQSGQSTAIADNPDLTGFYRRLLHPVFPGIRPVITLLWLNEKCIAAQFGMQTGDCLSLLKIAYAEEQAAYSPGSLLLQDVIAEAANRSVQTLSLVTSPAWASRWHPQTEPVWHVARYANNSGGLALKTFDRLTQSARARIRCAA